MLLKTNLQERADNGERGSLDDVKCVLNLANRYSDESYGNVHGDLDVDNSTGTTVKNLEADPISPFDSCPSIHKRASKKSSTTTIGKIDTIYMRILQVHHASYDIRPFTP